LARRIVLVRNPEHLSGQERGLPNGCTFGCGRLFFSSATFPSPFRGVLFFAGKTNCVCRIASAKTAGARSASAKKWRASIVVGVTKPIPGSGAMKPRRPRNDDRVMMWSAPE